MFRNLVPMLDERAKWDFIQEIDRFQQRLRHIQAMRCGPVDDLSQQASQEHLQRVTHIYAELGLRQKQQMTATPQ